MVYSLPNYKSKWHAHILQEVGHYKHPIRLYDSVYALQVLISVKPTLL